eukprot:TRINITY_DN1148_c0_g1_i1.p1 TRINITY_DN1148_c0_g1~~TRINITY_DN1148_c0_g1_i1.p1  ORF type:complete len:275 (+),score=48.57 TRINITY_DN1148_c0_g1_i1:71-895(+)
MLRPVAFWLLVWGSVAGDVDVFGRGTPDCPFYAYQPQIKVGTSYIFDYLVVPICRDDPAGNDAIWNFFRDAFFIPNGGSLDRGWMNISCYQRGYRNGPLIGPENVVPWSTNPNEMAYTQEPVPPIANSAAAVLEMCGFPQPTTCYSSIVLPPVSARYNEWGVQLTKGFPAVCHDSLLQPPAEELAGWKYLAANRQDLLVGAAGINAQTGVELGKCCWDRGYRWRSSYQPDFSGSLAEWYLKGERAVPLLDALRAKYPCNSTKGTTINNNVNKCM